MKLISFSDPAVRDEIRISDGLFYRRRGCTGLMIAKAGRGIHSHSAKAAWWGDDLFCLEVREWYGGRAVTLESQVHKWPNRIDVYRVNPEERFDYDREGAIAIMRKLCGKSYGYRHVAMASTSHLFGVRLLVEPNVSDIIDGDGLTVPPFCSEACAIADQIGGGVDPVPGLASRMTLPADLARSHLYASGYLFTLKP